MIIPCPLALLPNPHLFFKLPWLIWKAFSEERGTCTPLLQEHEIPGLSAGDILPEMMPNLELVFQVKMTPIQQMAHPRGLTVKGMKGKERDMNQYIYLEHMSCSLVYIFRETDRHQVGTSWGLATKQHIVTLHFGRGGCEIRDKGGILV